MCNRGLSQPGRRGVISGHKVPPCWKTESKTSAHLSLSVLEKQRTVSGLCVSHHQYTQHCVCIMQDFGNALDCSPLLIMQLIYRIHYSVTMVYLQHDEIRTPMIPRSLWKSVEDGLMSFINEGNVRSLLVPWFSTTDSALDRSFQPAPADLKTFL